MIDLYDFLYLDEAKLNSFISQIQGGRVSEITETIKQAGGLAAGINVGIPPLSGKVDASKSKESELQQTRLLTEPAYFKALRQYLDQTSQIQDITAASLQTRERLAVGQFIQVRCIVEPPVVETWITQVRSLFDFINRNMKLLTTTQKSSKGRATPAISSQQMGQFKAILDFLIDYINFSRKEPGKQYVRGTNEKQTFPVWSGLIPDYITTPLHSVLPAEVYLFGRVERLLREDETWKIVDLSQFNQANQATQLIDALNGFSLLLSQKKISEADLQIQYPDVIVSPIAIFR